VRQRGGDEAYQAIINVLADRSCNAYRAVRNAWWALHCYADRAEFVETTCELARTLLDGYHARERARLGSERACEAALAVFD
jgi:hypothetical protein